MTTSQLSERIQKDTKIARYIHDKLSIEVCDIVKECNITPSYAFHYLKRHGWTKISRRTWRKKSYDRRT